MTAAFRASRCRFELVVVRHGRTEWNRDGRFQGHSDVSLDDAGRAQARGLARELAAQRFARALTSDLSRARETAAIVLGARAAQLECDARWREMRFGAWEGLTWAQIVERNPALAERSPKAPRFFTPEGGETFDELCVRVRDALAAIDARASDGDAIFVATHAGPLHALLHVALGRSQAEALGVKFEPATITRLRIAPEGASVIELNRPAAAVAS